MREDDSGYAGSITMLHDIPIEKEVYSSIRMEAAIAELDAIIRQMTTEAVRTAETIENIAQYTLRERD